MCARSDARYVERARKLRQVLNLVPAGSSGTTQQLFEVQYARELRGMKGLSWIIVPGLGAAPARWGERSTGGGLWPGSLW